VGQERRLADVEEDLGGLPIRSQVEPRRGPGSQLPLLDEDPLLVGYRLVGASAAGEAWPEQQRRTREDAQHAAIVARLESGRQIDSWQGPLWGNGGVAGSVEMT
jgi:hypothetical protein